MATSVSKAACLSSFSFQSLWHCQYNDVVIYRLQIASKSTSRALSFTLLPNPLFFLSSPFHPWKAHNALQPFRLRNACAPHQSLGPARVGKTGSFHVGVPSGADFGRIRLFREQKSFMRVKARLRAKALVFDYMSERYDGE